jgi:hypothetical protein
VKKGDEPKKGKVEEVEPGETAPALLPPPPQEDMAPPPGSGADQAPIKNGKPKGKKGKDKDSESDEGQQQQMLPPEEAGPPPPPPPSGDTPPETNKNGKPKDKKGKGDGHGAHCPEGLVPEDGSCVPAQ